MSGNLTVSYQPENEKWYIVEDMGGNGTRSWSRTCVGGRVHGFDSEEEARKFIKEPYSLGSISIMEHKCLT